MISSQARSDALPEEGAGGSRRRSARFRWLEGGVWLLPCLAPFVFPDHLVLGSQLLVAGLFVLSLDLLLGYAGIVSLGHAAFFGLGAYAAGLLSAGGFGEPLSGLAVAALVAALAGLSSSFLVVGGRTLTRLMVTLGIGMMLHEAANQASDWTGGMDGLVGVETWPLLGVWHFDLFGRVAYGYSFAVLLGCFLLLRRLVASPFGLVLRGIRENERRMPAIGVAVRRHLAAAYTLSAALAGVAGAVSAQTTEFVGLEALSFERSASALIMLVLGGTGHLYGALLGTALYMLLREAFADLDPAYWQFWLGLVVMATPFLARGGLLGRAQSLIGRLRKGSGKPRAAGKAT